MNKIFIITFALLILSSGALADCTVPKDSLIIMNDTVFCPGTYSLAEGMVINADNLMVECNSTEIIGTDEGYGIIINSRRGNTIEGCSISGFQMGMALISSSHNLLKGNTVSDDEIGIFLADSLANEISGNHILDNSKTGITVTDSSMNSIHDNTINKSDYGIYMITSYDNNISGNVISSLSLGFYINKDNSGNIIYGNKIYNVGFSALMLSDTDNVYCKDGIDNTYLSGAIGPGCEPITSVNITQGIEEDMPKNNADEPNQPVTTSEEEPENITLEEDTTESPVEESSRIRDQVIEEFQLQKDASDDESIDILRRALMIEGLSGSQLDTALNNRIDDYFKTKEQLKIDKRLITDYSLNRTTISILITPLTTIYDLYVYEFVPKCVADSIESIRFHHEEPLKILEPDPLFVWYFPKVSEGDVLNLSYEVDQAVEFTPTTIAIVNGTRIIKRGEGECGDEPLSIPAGDCDRTAMEIFLSPLLDKWKLLLPILLIPIIVILYIVFHKFQIRF